MSLSTVALLLRMRLSGQTMDLLLGNPLRDCDSAVKRGRKTKTNFERIVAALVINKALMQEHKGASVLPQSFERNSVRHKLVGRRAHCASSGSQRLWKHVSSLVRHTVRQSDRRTDRFAIVHWNNLLTLKLHSWQSACRAGEWTHGELAGSKGQQTTGRIRNAICLPGKMQIVWLPEDGRGYVCLEVS